MAWDDPVIGANWGLVDPVLSNRDRVNPVRADLVTDQIPLFDAGPAGRDVS